MKQPPYLKAGDRVRIISSARKISRDELQPAIELLESWDLVVELGDRLFYEDRQFSGTEEERKLDLQAAIDDTSIKAIFFARGGYGSVQIVDQIDWSSLEQHPKWLVGYSDITVFHAHLNTLGLESLHATMPINIKADKSGLSKEGEESLKAALFGEDVNHSFATSDKNQFQGDSISGELIGGNLSILYSLSGSPSQMSGQDKIILIEDLDEYLYHIDRMMMNLIRSGLFEGCKALLVGGMSDMNDNTIPYGQSAEEIISQRMNELGIPVVFDVPSGHIFDNRAMIFGRRVSLLQDGSRMKLNFHGRT